MRPDTILQLQADARVYGLLCRHADSGRARKRLDARRADLQACGIALRERRRRASEGATQKAIDVNVGKILERIAAVCDGFGSVPRDCRPLFDPIDYVAFNGLALHGEVKSITFLDVKTGGGGLNPRQRQIRAVVEAGKVEWQEYAIEGRP